MLTKRYKSPAENAGACNAIHPLSLFARTSEYFNIQSKQSPIKSWDCAQASHAKRQKSHNTCALSLMNPPLSHGKRSCSVRRACSTEPLSQSRLSRQTRIMRSYWAIHSECTPHSKVFTPPVELEVTVIYSTVLYTYKPQVNFGKKAAGCKYIWWSLCSKFVCAKSNKVFTIPVHSMSFCWSMPNVTQRFEV